MDLTDTPLSTWSFGLATLCYFILASYLLSFGKEWRNSIWARRIVGATVLSTCWALITALELTQKSALLTITASTLDICRYGIWYSFLISILFPKLGDERVARESTSWTIQLCSLLISIGIATQIVLIGGWLKPEIWQRAQVFQGLAEAVAGLILVEQLFRTVSKDSRWNIKPLCLALLFQFGYDIYLFSDGVMFNHLDGDAVTVRGFVQAITVPLLMLSTERSRDWTSKIRISQKAAFHSITLLASGIYLLFIASVGYYVRFFGGDWGRALQLALILAAILGLGILLVSGSMRAKLKVLVGKHFFHYRYDYREEWLRFTQALTAQESPQSMGEQVIRGLADMVESPAGAIWLREAGRHFYTQTGRWNLPESAGTELDDSPLCKFLLGSGWVINLEEYRCFPGRYSGLEIPPWLSGLPNAWLIIPLMVGHEMQGFVILASSRTPINVNWEVNDLLRTAGCQAASFLAKMQATEALLEVRKFDAFNKMSAFVVHDLKNIITQLSLLLKNAERHKDNPEFQQDMLMTVDNAVERMRQLMLQLREGAKPPGGVCGINLVDIAKRIQKDKMALGRLVEIDADEGLIARGHDERMERVLGHLVQNALDASTPESRVWIEIKRKNDKAALVVGDSGHGMSTEFIRDRLFKPFQSTKEAGMGIGAYESAQYIRELGGEMHVDSELGKGTSVTIILPLFVIRTDSDLIERKVA